MIVNLEFKGKTLYAIALHLIVLALEGESRAYGRACSKKNK